MKSKGKVALYNPYLDILGGGEKHILSICKVFDEAGYDIEVLWDDLKIKDKIQEDLNITFKRLSIVPNFLNKGLKKTVKTAKYDYFFYVTDGSYFASLAKHNYIFAMVPLKSLYTKSLSNRLKWLNWNFISNSKYTKKWLDKWGIDSQEIYPYIDDIFFQKWKKEKIILSVGRFFSHLHSKKQSEMIDLFKDIKQQDKKFKEFKLYLAGRVRTEDKAHLDLIKKKAKERDDIVFKTNISVKELKSLYGRALMYWHYTGFEEDREKHPERVEHLGMSILEAMASGCIVFAYEAGGAKELIEEENNGFLFDRSEKLYYKAKYIIKNNTAAEKIRKRAVSYVKAEFSYSVFKKNIIEKFKIH